MGAKTTERRWTLAACAVLVAVAVGAVAFQGAPRFSPPRMFLPPAPIPTGGVNENRATGTPQPQPLYHETRIDLSWLLVALIVLAVVVALALLWRLRRVRRAAPQLPPLVSAADTATTVPRAEPEPEPAPVRRGLARALETLSEHREPRDAIERAWLGLEEGAADSGIRRLPAETPAEFSARVVARVDADRDAAHALLSLYLRARFSQAAITSADVAAARQAIEMLQASWSGTHAGGRR